MTSGSGGPIGADFLQLDPAGVPPRERCAWLTAQLRAAVLEGRLTDGTRLPPTRTLATDLAFSRGVVVEAYQRLTEEGLITSKTGAGTQVINPHPSTQPSTPRPATTAPRPATPRPATTAPRPATPRPATTAPRPATPRPATATTSATPVPGPTPTPWLHHGAGPGGAAVEIDLWPGVPDLSTFPRAAWLRAESAVLASAGNAELGYGEPAGHPVLRRELAAWLARGRGVHAGPNDVVVVAGVAQALTLTAQVLTARGEREIAVEDPGSWGVTSTLARWGLRPVAVPVDEHGIRVAEIPDDVRSVVLTPAHQFPTGVVLAPERRREVLARANEQDGLIVEDDYDAEYRYDRRPVPALQAGAPDRVIHTGSTSKTLAPGLRLGWMIVPAHLRDEVVAAKYAADISSPTLTQLVFARLLSDGAFERHLRLARRRQRTRRDALLDGLRTVPGRVHGVPAGLHLLLTLPDGAGTPDESTVVERLARDGVRVQPLSMHRTAPGPAGLVLGYSAVPPDRLREAARRIATALG